MKILLKNFIKTFLKELYFKDEMSPLKYSSKQERKRLSLIDPDVSSPDLKDLYFAETENIVIYSPSGKIYKKPKIKKISGSSPGVVGFIDYSILSDGGIYIDYLVVRRDQRGKRYSKMLIDELYKKYNSSPYINFGDIMSNIIEKIFLGKRKLTTGPKTIGKL